jgi:MSHA pilin protein MshC
MRESDVVGQQGFTLIELITVMILISIICVTLMSRLTSVTSANVQASRDDLIAALFFAQQMAMVRSNIAVTISASAITVTENNVAFSQGYPLQFASGVTATPTTVSYTDKLAQTSPVTITLTGAGGYSASVIVEASGYAH